jgi:hypothetical protein
MITTYQQQQKINLLWIPQNDSCKMAMSREPWTEYPSYTCQSLLRRFYPFSILLFLSNKFPTAQMLPALEIFHPSRANATYSSIHHTAHKTREDSILCDKHQVHINWWTLESIKTETGLNGNVSLSEDFSGSDENTESTSNNGKCLSRKGENKSFSGQDRLVVL